jgi:hypothetical protein
VHLTSAPKSCQDLLNDAEQSMMEYKTSIQNLKKESKYTLDKVAVGESDLQRGRTDLRYFTFSLSWKSLFFFPCLLLFHLIMVCHQHTVKLLHVPLSRSTGKQIQSLIGSIYKAESTAAGITYISSGYLVHCF